MTVNIPNSDGATFRANVNTEFNQVDAISVNGISLWKGTTAEYNAISPKDPDTIYHITD